MKLETLARTRKQAAEKKKRKAPMPETLRPDIEAAIRDQFAPRPDTTDLIAWIVAQTRKETRA